jgi:hypothetical protein
MQNHEFKETRDLLKKEYEIAMLVENIESDFKYIGIRLRNLVIFEDEQALQNQLTKIQLESDRVQENIHQLESLVEEPEQKELVDTLLNVISEFHVYKDEVVHAAM